MSLRGLSIALLLCLCADAAWRWGDSSAAVTPPRFAVAPSPDPVLQCAPPLIWQQGRLSMPADTPAAHASTLVALDDRHPLAAHKSMVAFWFAGTRESGSDVGIAAATYDRQQANWDAAQWVVTRDMLQAQLGVAVRRIGNPVAWRDVDGRLHLYVVATGLGGWAASRVVHLVEAPADSAATSLLFVADRILPLMPLATWFNTSTLVRALPQPLDDGGALVPMYFELGTKYGLAVRIGPRGELRDVRRMTERRDVLQPTVVATSPTEAVALMRDSGPHQRVAWSRTEDGGLHWQDQTDAPVGNPDSSLAAVRLPSGEWWVAHNPLAERRSMLLLSRVHDARGDWTSTVLARGEEGSEYSYPSMVWIDKPPTEWRANTRGGHTSEVWVSYTDRRQAIAYVRLVVNCQSSPTRGRTP